MTDTEEEIKLFFSDNSDEKLNFYFINGSKREN
jgi:hypothetical protein